MDWELAPLLPYSVKYAGYGIKRGKLSVDVGYAVKEYLAGKQLPPKRPFLGAAKPAALDAKWTPRAELNLLTN